MLKHINKRSRKIGLPAGSLVHLGEKKTESIKISIIDYTEKKLQERVVSKVEECFPYRSTSTVTWIDIEGVHDVAVIEQLGKHYGLHPLLMEDILTTDQRPKFEEYGDYIFTVLRMLYRNEKNDLVSEQISLVIGKNFVISFKESNRDVFNPVRERIRSKKGKIRSAGSDFLAYTLIDTILDNYFLVLETTAEHIEVLEGKLIENPRKEVINGIHVLKREIIYLSQAAWPLRELIDNLIARDSPLIKSATKVYLRDVYDHIIEVIDIMEMHREVLSGMVDIYLSSMSNKLNEVMKVLTVIATIFMPLTFLAGVYGMNFHYFPEITWKYGYIYFWTTIIVSVIIMLVYFKRKKWI